MSVEHRFRARDAGKQRYRRQGPGKATETSPPASQQALWGSLSLALVLLRSSIRDDQGENRRARIVRLGDDPLMWLLYHWISFQLTLL